MFSQRDEEKYILRFFKGGQGRFLDIGAYDGKTFSNTHQLALQGWGGVCIEPSPSVTGPLEKLYWNNNKIKILKVGIGVKRGTFPFYNFYGDAVGTFDIEHAKLWSEKGKRKWIEIQVEVITVDDLFSHIDYNFHFVNIDAEGWSFAILQNLPFDKLTKLKMICVEFDGQSQRILDLTVKYKFRLYHSTAENLLLVR